MTATTLSTRGRSANKAPGFGAALNAEWTKLRSIRSTWIIIMLALVLGIGFSAGTALISGLTHDDWSAEAAEAFDPVVATSSGSLFVGILLITLAVTAVTSEYSSGLIRTTFIGTPRRSMVLAAKATVIGLMGLVISAITIPGMFLVSQPIFEHYGLETATITDGATFRTLTTIVLAQGLIYTLIPFSIGWLLRGTAGAITASLGFLWLPSMLGPILPDWGKANVIAYLPVEAMNSLSGAIEFDAPQYLSQNPAIVVIAAWLIGFILASAIVLNRRDA